MLTVKTRGPGNAGPCKGKCPRAPAGQGAGLGAERGRREATQATAHGTQPSRCFSAFVLCFQSLFFSFFSCFK